MFILAYFREAKIECGAALRVVAQVFPDRLAQSVVMGSQPCFQTMTERGGGPQKLLGGRKQGPVSESAGTGSDTGWTPRCWRTCREMFR